MYRARNPVLLILFNRPEQTAKVFDTLRKVQPERLYLAADAPRLNRAGEAQKCEAVLNIFSTVDWPCEVYRRVLDTNVGCDVNVTSGVDWFFENEETGVVLEDDCVPNESFFRYCDELLEKYKDNDRVMWINGFNNGYNSGEPSPSYFYSIYALSWGWASWRRAWRCFRDGGRNLLANGTSETIWPEYIKKSYMARLFWRYSFKYGRVTRAWDFRWLNCIWANGGLACTPSKNLISNIGYGVEGVHGGSRNDPRGNLPTVELQEDLVGPSDVTSSAPLDAYLSKTFYRIGIYTVIKTYVASQSPYVRKLIRRIRGKSY